MKDTMKGIGTVIAILGGIGTLIIVIGAGGLGEALHVKGFGFIMFCTSAFSVAIFASIFFAFAKILENQEDMMERLNRISSQTSSTESALKNGSKDTAKAAGNQASSNDGEMLETKLMVENLYYENGPIIIKKGSLIKYRNTAKYTIIIKNIGAKTITAAKLGFITKNALGEISNQVKEYVFADLSIEQGKLFGRDTQIDLGTPGVSEAAVMVDTLMFADGSRWERGESRLVNYIPNSAFDLNDHIDELNRLGSAREICEYIKALNTDDETVIEKIIPELEKEVEMERFYGNHKDKAIKRIESIV